MKEKAIKRSTVPSKEKARLPGSPDDSCTIDVIIESCPGVPKEKIPGVAAKLNGSGHLVLQELIVKLKTLGFLPDSYLVSYLSEELGMYVFCGKDPVSLSVVVPQKEFMPNKSLTIKAIKQNGSIFEELAHVSQPKGTKAESEANRKLEQRNKGGLSSNNNQLVRCRRTKERRIGDVVEKVSLWRRLYNGFNDSQGNIIKLTLEDAARRVNVSKKSLDDYLLHIRSGRRFGFNFNEHAHDNFGVLRAFIKKNKKTLLANATANQSMMKENSKETSIDTPIFQGYQAVHDKSNAEVSSIIGDEPVSFLEGANSFEMEFIHRQTPDWYEYSGPPEMGLVEGFVKEEEPEDHFNEFWFYEYPFSSKQVS